MDLNGNISMLRSELRSFQPSKRQREAEKKTKRQCLKCLIQIQHGSLMRHLKNVHGLQTVSEVDCDICHLSVNKFNLEYQKKKSPF